MESLSPVVQMNSSARITIPEIAQRLAIGPQSVYRLLEQGVIPGIRLGHRWIVGRYAYTAWEHADWRREQRGAGAA
jgi:excisionase family DNA binding protein